MSYVQIDPLAVRSLTATMRSGADTMEANADSIRSSLSLVDLTDTSPCRIDDRAERWRTEAVTLDERVDQVESFLFAMGEDLDPGRMTVIEYAGSVGPSMEHADGMINSLLSVEDGLAAFGGSTSGGAARAAMEAQRDSLRNELQRLTGLHGPMLDTFLVVRGVDLLNEQVQWLEALPPTVADAMGLDAAIRRRDEFLEPFAQLMPEGVFEQFAADIRQGKTMVEALSAATVDIGVGADRSAGLADAQRALDAHGGTLEDAYDDGAIDAGDLYYLAPIQTRTTDFFVHPVAYSPEPHWLDREVNYYWYFLHYQGAGMQSTAWADQQVAAMPGIDTSPEPLTEDGGSLDWGDVGSFLLSAAQWLTSFAEGCIAFTGAAVKSPMYAMAVSGAFFPGAGTALAVGACLVGGVATAGIGDYDGIGPVGP